MDSERLAHLLVEIREEIRETNRLLRDLSRAPSSGPVRITGTVGTPRQN